MANLPKPLSLGTGNTGTFTSSNQIQNNPSVTSTSNTAANPVNPIQPISNSQHQHKLLPIAPLIAPKPASNLASSINNVGMLPNSNSKPSGIITSKQWVLPPRPKAGRKPTTSNTNNNSNISTSTPTPNISNTQTPSPAPTSTTNNTNSTIINETETNQIIPNLGSRKNSVNSLSNNISNLKISNFEIAKKNELDLATEENLKLKNIISRLKFEIDSLKSDLTIDLNTNNSSTTNKISNSISNSNSNSNNTIIDTNYDVDLSPTINPIIITQKSNNSNDSKKKVKRTYKKKAKKIVVEDSPSPISLNELNRVKSNNNGIPNIDQILNNNNTSIDVNSISEESIKKKKIKVPKPPKVPKKKKEPKIKKEFKDSSSSDIITSSLLTKQMLNPLDQTLLPSNDSPSIIKIEKISENFSQFSSAFNPTSINNLNSAFNSPAALHHGFNSAQLSRTTTIGTLNTLDTLDTIDSLGTLDTYDDTEESSWLDNHIITQNNDNNNNNINNIIQNGRRTHYEGHNLSSSIPRTNLNEINDFEYLDIDGGANDLDINAFMK